MNCWIDINSEAIQKNYDIFTSLLGPGRMAPVLKSNAYGHGLRETFHAIVDKAPQWICLNYTSEASILRKLGYRGQILIVGPSFENDMKEAYETDADLVLVSKDQLSQWSALKNKPSVHIKIETGMHRQGFLRDEWPSVADSLKNDKPLVKAVCTHFANVEDVLEQDFALAQLRQIKEAADFFTKQKFTVSVHAAASASTLILPDSRLDMGRIGISLYGLWPSPETRLSYLQQNDRIVDLEPALTWKTKISQIKPVDSGEYVGYGITFRASKPMKIAVLPVGYNEGYPRLTGEKQSYVLLQGRRAPVVGRICMNMMMIDVTHIDSAAREDEVILLGKDKITDEEISAAQFAEWSGTIHYEALTRLNTAIPRSLV
jgi:alanine racemase